MVELAEKVAELGGDIHGSLQEVPLPMYVLDRKGVIVWVNDAAEAIVPGAIGRKYTEALAPDQVHSARRIFARRIMGQAPFTDHTTTVRLPEGGRLEVDVSSVPLRKGHQIVGVFGVMRPHEPDLDAAPASPDVPTLTPRQAEVLRMLGSGMTTQQMADRMGLSPETVRNHVKATLGELNAKSRLEAVLTAYRLGLLQRPPASRED
ncbi:MAG TPA: LuxR C-terminal-related transcriptional regulator [Gaiellaceae bacterium]|nr:LuxR C-terminal-related transcriptional regulator [Gaiellaceae bacterium]